MRNWKVLGDEKEGAIFYGANTYRYSIEDDQVRVRLPFLVDQERLEQLLKEDGWVVADTRDLDDAKAWGPGPDEDGYYPCWVWPDPERGETIFAFPPRDYHATVEESNDEPAMSHEPVFGAKALEELISWIPTLEQSAVDGSVTH